MSSCQAARAKNAKYEFEKHRLWGLRFPGLINLEKEAGLSGLSANHPTFYMPLAEKATPILYVLATVPIHHTKLTDITLRQCRMPMRLISMREFNQLESLSV
jgi:hypothetical protein